MFRAVVMHAVCTDASTDVAETHAAFFDVLEKEVRHRVLELCLLLFCVDNFWWSQVERRREFCRVSMAESVIPRSLALSEDGSILRTIVPFQYGTVVLSKG